MSRLTVNLEAMLENLTVVDGWVRDYGARWTLVTKVLSGWEDVLHALVASGVRSVADSRLENFDVMPGIPGDLECWYLRPPSLSKLARIVAGTHVSLNSDAGVVEALGREAGRQGKTHSIVVMVELGDLREGVAPGALGAFFERAGSVDNIRVVGLGSNLGCLSGAVPTVDQFSQLALYRELMKLKFGAELPLISAGTSAVLPLIRKGDLPPGVNHFRIGEAVFLGTDLISGGNMEGLRDDVVRFEAEVVEVGEKSSSPAGEILDMGPFDQIGGPAGDNARDVRAVISVGQLDTVVQGLTCETPEFSLVGASSDLAVISLGANHEGVKAGDMLGFKPSYGALVRLTAGRYVEKTTTPSLEEFLADLGDKKPVALDPLIPGLG